MSSLSPSASVPVSPLPSPLWAERLMDKLKAGDPVCWDRLEQEGARPWHGVGIHYTWYSFAALVLMQPDAERARRWAHMYALHTDPPDLEDALVRAYVFPTGNSQDGPDEAWESLLEVALNTTSDWAWPMALEIYRRYRSAEASEELWTVWLEAWDRYLKDKDFHAALTDSEWEVVCPRVLQGGRAEMRRLQEGGWLGPLPASCQRLWAKIEPRLPEGEPQDWAIEGTPTEEAFPPENDHFRGAWENPSYLLHPQTNRPLTIEESRWRWRLAIEMGVQPTDRLDSGIHQTWGILAWSAPSVPKDVRQTLKAQHAPETWWANDASKWWNQVQDIWNRHRYATDPVLTTEDRDRMMHTTGEGLWHYVQATASANPIRAWWTWGVAPWFKDIETTRVNLEGYANEPWAAQQRQNLITSSEDLENWLMHAFAQGWLKVSELRATQVQKLIEQTGQWGWQRLVRHLATQSAALAAPETWLRQGDYVCVRAWPWEQLPVPIRQALGQALDPLPPPRSPADAAAQRALQLKARLEEAPPVPSRGRRDRWRS